MIIKDEAYPQELFARELWNQHLINPFISLKEFKELMKQYNLKPKKGVSISDIKVKVFGRIKYMHGCKYSYLNVEYMAEEIDKLCTIDRWDLHLLRYSK